MHRGTKEMDLILGNFVKKYINEFNIIELKDLEKLLFNEDEIIYKWYIEKYSKKKAKVYHNHYLLYLKALFFVLLQIYAVHQ